MVKVIVHLAKAVIVVMTALLFFSCGFDSKSVNGDGNVTTQNRNISGAFTSVTAGKGLEVTIEQGAQASVTVEADKNLQQHIKTELKGSTLEITADANIGNADAKRVIVIMPNIKRIEAAGGSSVTSKGSFKEDTIELNANGGGFLKATVNSRNLKSDTSGGANIELTGTSNNFELHASNGSHIEASGLIVENVRAETSSGATVVVNPVKNLSAEASGGGGILYIKTPAQLKQNASTGGSIAQKQ